MPQNLGYCFPLKEYISNIVLTFYLSPKLKDPVENSSGTFEEREKTGEWERQEVGRSTDKQHRI